MTDIKLRSAEQIVGRLYDEIAEIAAEHEEYKQYFQAGELGFDETLDQFAQQKGKLFLIRDLLAYIAPELSWGGGSDTALELIEKIEGFTGYDEDEDEEFPHIRSLYDQDVGDLQ